MESGRRLESNPFVRLIPIDVPHFRRQMLEDFGAEERFSGGDRIWAAEGASVVTTTPVHRLVTFARKIANGQFVASITFAAKDGKPVIWGVTVRPTDEGQELPHYGLTVRNVRDAVKRLDDEARTQLSESDPTGALAFLRSEPRSGRIPSATAVDHALLAWAFVSALNEAPRKPLRYLADKTKIEHDRLRGWRTEAVRNGFLSRSPGRGIAGGGLTDLAVGALKSENFDLDRDDAYSAFVTSDRAAKEVTRTALP